MKKIIYPIIISLPVITIICLIVWVYISKPKGPLVSLQQKEGAHFSMYFYKNGKEFTHWAGMGKVVIRQLSEQDFDGCDSLIIKYEP